MKDASAVELIRIGAWTTVGALAVYIIPGLVVSLLWPKSKTITVAQKATPCGCGGR